MKHLRFILAFVVYTCSWALAVPPLSEQNVRVLLFSAAEAITVTAPGAHRGASAHATFETELGLAWPIEQRGATLFVDDTAVGSVFTLTPIGSDYLELDGLPYRGAIAVHAGADGALFVVNTLPVDDYLRGVLPSEMPPNWPDEALKAQAVASRTYTLASLQPDEPYDLCATTDCQVYGGYLVEHERTNAAITATEGEVVMYGSELAQTYYHSDSGGYVASSSEVWGSQLPYLTARSDVPVSTPHRSWTFRIDPNVVASDLRVLGYAPGVVQALRIVSRSDSGRVTSADIITSTGAIRLAGSQLSGLLRGWGMKSTRFRMTGDFSATGDGWGHGVGMSQYGARALATNGSNYHDILAFYYPQTIVTAAPQAEPQRYIQW